MSRASGVPLMNPPSIRMPGMVMFLTTTNRARFTPRSVRPRLRTKRRVHGGCQRDVGRIIRVAGVLDVVAVAQILFVHRRHAARRQTVGLQTGRAAAYCSC